MNFISFWGDVEISSHHTIHVSYKVRRSWKLVWHFPQYYNTNFVRPLPHRERTEDSISARILILSVRDLNFALMISRLSYVPSDRHTHQCGMRRKCKFIYRAVSKYLFSTTFTFTKSDDVDRDLIQFGIFDLWSLNSNILQLRLQRWPEYSWWWHSDVTTKFISMIGRSWVVCEI